MVLNIAAYHFVAIDDPRALADALHARAAAAGLRGTLLVAPEGLNLFLAGAPTALRGFLDQLRADPRFATLKAKQSHSATVPFARLKAKVKPEIITFGHAGTAPLGRGRAPAVSPHDLARWLDQGCDDAGRPVALLDTRNEEEVGHGSFVGALTLPITDFTQLPDALAPHRPALAGATVVSFCTGGVRCEKAALWMGDTGMANVLQLEGGILGYFEQVGGRHYDGACFVFDQRVALRPDLSPVAPQD
ncbi:rhodanese superfamily protein [Pseudoxanthomonas spadix BD-a59]|uniref:Rhodanese superfamily protein n=1 Tax=Pseudoxanthomonas spadix (strain BD-a59) TaxID=1045855 RepID=G7UR51_PSEUP|nr:sulfurtransferase [Pseudoxanthomonas spadix]AER55862.1 rhodanese superfamily protein [Pseudoxanthomonas spadix BD-a59]